MAAIETALMLGTAGSLLGVVARRTPIVAWLALAPLGAALSLSGAWAGFAGALFGAVVHGSSMLDQPARLRPLGFVFGALGWGLAASAGGIALGALRAHAVMSEGVALALVLPAVAFLATLPMRLAGAPRWVHAALACTQEPWPVVIRAGWFGGEVTVTALLSFGAVAACLVVPEVAWDPALSALLGALVLVVLCASAWSLARTRRSIARQPRIRVAAVVADGAPPDGAAADGLWPLRSPDYRDVDASVLRYAPHVARAAREGAELIVLPEVAAVLGGAAAERWLEAASRWASEHGAVVVAPHFDPDLPINTLTVVEPSGRRSTYDKQHPAPGLEPAPRREQPPGPHGLARGWALSTVICVDLDYGDLIGPVRAAGGVLAVPANDWLGFAEQHDRTSIWAAVLTATTVLRATGHGICSARDGAGSLLARASSLDGPAVMVVDVPVASR